LSSLEIQQRGLLSLIKDRAPVLQDPYLQQVSESRELVLIRRIALWWRLYALERQCRFTGKLLKQLGRFESFAASYFETCAASPFVEEVSLEFLRWLIDREASIVQSVARFELALLEIRAGVTDNAIVQWDRHPGGVIEALEANQTIPAREVGSVYRMQVRAPAPGQIECVRLSDKAMTIP
jgi:hypothetical protein